MNRTAKCIWLAGRKNAGIMSAFFFLPDRLSEILSQFTGIFSTYFPDPPYTLCQILIHLFRHLPYIFYGHGHTPFSAIHQDLAPSTEEC
jgi:hypothetical protein